MNIRNWVTAAVLAAWLTSSAGTAQMVHADMVSAVKQTEPAMSKILKLKPMQLPAGQQRAATRKEAIDLLDQMFEHYRPAFRLTPRPFRIVQAQIDKHNQDQATREKLAKLSRWGVIGPVGPLVTGGDSLTNQQFGDSLGYFYAGVASLTYQPDPRWSPDLGTGD